MIFKPLASVANIIAGQSPESSTYNSVGDGLPFFQGKADFQDMHPTVRMWCTSTKRKVAEPGDILISVRAPVGAVNICNQKSIIGRGLSAIRPSSSLDGKFLYYYLKANERQIDALGTGSTFKAITQDTLKKISILLPPLDDQIRIAHLLGKVEELIAQRKQHLQQLDDLLKSVFLEMFGDPVRNEKGWELRTLGTIGDVKGGLQVAMKRNDYELDAPYLRVANVYRDRLNLSEIKRIGLTPAELDRVRLQKGDLLIVEGHGNPAEIGRSAVWDGSIENCVHQNHLIRVRVDSSQITPLYASFFINSPGGRQQMFRAGKTTSGLNTISSKNVKETIVVVPPLELQNQFATIVEKVEGIKSCYKLSLTNLEALYGALSQQAFKGELDLARVQLPNNQGSQIHGEQVEQPKQADRSSLPEGTVTPTEVINNLVQGAQTQERSELLARWFRQYLTNTSPNASLGSAQFLEEAWQTLQETQLEDEGETPALTLDDYDALKDLVFKALASGELNQTFDEDSNRVALQKQPANWGTW